MTNPSPQQVDYCTPTARAFAPQAVPRGNIARATLGVCEPEREPPGGVREYTAVRASHGGYDSRRYDGGLGGRGGGVYND